MSSKLLVTNVVSCIHLHIESEFYFSSLIRQKSKMDQKKTLLHVFVLTIFCYCRKYSKPHDENSNGDNPCIICFLSVVK